MNPAIRLVADWGTMLRRQVIHMVRYPLVLMLVAVPVILLLLFVYVFGETMGAGLGGVSGGRAEYLAYIIPGILLMTVASGAQGTAITIAMDMTEGIMARFRTMSISRSAVLGGHVGISVLQTLASVLLVIGVALLMGFRSPAGPVAWVEALALIVLITLAVTWLSVACGLVTNSVEAASNLPMPLILLPFFGSGFVPTESMPRWLQWFADYQPFTPMMETVRALLSGATVGSEGILAVVWCLAIGAFGYVASMRLYERKSAK